MEESKFNKNKATNLVLDKVNETLKKLDASVPWFDVYIFLKYVLKALCIYCIADTSLLVLAFIVIYRVVSEMEDPSKPKEWKQKESSGKSSLDQSKYRISIPMVYQFSFNFLVQYGTLLLIYLMSYIGISLLAFILACYASILDTPKSLDDKLALENLDEAKLKFLLQRLGAQVPEWLKTPEHERVEWLNKVIKQMWPYLGSYSEDYIKYKILPGLRFDLHDKDLISGKIPPRVSSVKVRETTEKVLLDVSILYDGDFSASFEVKKGVELEIDQIKVDAELTIELKNFVGHSPFVGCIVVHMDKLPKVNVKLKRMGSIIEYSKLAKRACLDYIQKQIKAFFPRHHDFLRDTSGILKVESVRPKEELGSIRNRFSFHFGSTRHSSRDREENISQTKSERDLFRVHSESSLKFSDHLVDDLSQDYLSIQSQSVTAVTNNFGHSEPEDVELTFSTTINQDDFKEHDEPSIKHVSGTESSSRRESISCTETDGSQTALGKWEGGLRDAIARDVAHSRQSMQEVDSHVTAETVSVMTEESVEPFTLISREGLAGSLGCDDSHGCIELTTVYKVPSTLLVVVHKVRNLPRKGGRTPNPYVKLHLLSTALKELREESTDSIENTCDPEYETTFAFPLTKPLSEYSLKVSTKTKHKRPHYLGRVVLCFVPSTSSKKIKERAWYDLADPKKDYVTCFVGYKDANRSTSFTRNPPDSFDGVPSSGSESDEV